MTKLSSLSLAAALSILLLGCGGNSPSSHDAQSQDYIYLNKTLTQEKVYNGIYKAGQNAGWKMTKFKSNMFIAEKTHNGDTQAVDILFNKESFSLSPQNNDLEDAILEELNK
jgi:hypothetical protein